MAPPLSSSPFFGIRVVDEVTGRGVPLVELTTVNNITFVTDSNGWAAIGEMGLMGNETFFHLRSHGYTFPKDNFGYAGVRLTPTPGGRVRVKIRRVNLAERICRLTGEGIYADSLLLKEPVPLNLPALSGKVLGQDTALAAVYKGKMLWFWGDTNRPGYPLGNFRTTGAVASFPKGHQTADAGLDFRYFTGADGFAREMCPSQKPGPIWVGGVVVIGEVGREELFAHYARIKDLATRSEHGYVQWDDSRNTFRFIKELALDNQWAYLDGHPFHFSEGGTAYLMGHFCFPTVRVPDNKQALLNPQAFEAFTCLDARGDVVRDASGAVSYRWQKEVAPISPEKEAELTKQNKLRLDEARFLPRDPSGNIVIMQGGSVTWNGWRKKWLLIATQKFGKESALGEIWYSEADHPTGPWRRAVKILTHDKYTFYNPVHHPFLDADKGRLIYFEGTYTTTFSGNTVQTPRYDYNQMLYRLDLADGRLNVIR